MASFIRSKVAQTARVAAMYTPLKASHYTTAFRYSYYFLFGAAAVSSTNTLLVETQYISGPSMAPTLSPSYSTTGEQDSVLVRRRAPLSTEYSVFTHARNAIERGDVVLFIRPHDPEGEAIKRVLAVEGDTVWRDVRRIGLEKKMGDVWTKERGLLPVPPVVKVPIGHVWVEGDNWRESLDSNTFGPISLSLVTGRATKIVRPYSRWGKIPPKKDTNDFSRTRVVPGPVEYPPGFEPDSG
jgi:inner membrane protease subunit 2